MSLATSPQPTVSTAVSTKVESLVGEVMHSLQKDMVRVGVLAAAGVAVRGLAANGGQHYFARVDPQILLGAVALIGGLITAGATGQLSRPSPAVPALPGPSDPGTAASWASSLQVVLTPFEVLLGLVALVAIDQTDLTVRLLDSVARGLKTLLAALSSLPWIANAGTGDVRRRGRSGSQRQPPSSKRLKPLPPSLTRSLSRRQRYELDGLRLMREDDPIRALRDCVKSFGWRACQAIFM